MLKLKIVGKSGRNGTGDSHTRLQRLSNPIENKLPALDGSVSVTHPNLNVNILDRPGQLLPGVYTSLRGFHLTKSNIRQAGAGFLLLTVSFFFFLNILRNATIYRAEPGHLARGSFSHPKRNKCTDEPGHLARGLHQLRLPAVRPGQAVLAGRNESSRKRKVAGVGHGGECLRYN